MSLTEREMAIILIDNDCLKKSDAIVLLEGDGLNRYRKAAELFKAGWASKIVFSGGITDHSYGSFPFSDVEPFLIEAGVPSTATIHEDRSKNTRDQAIEVIKLAHKNGWSKLILVATHNHQYRAYLTFLREVIDSGNNILLYNSPVRNLGWFSETGWGTRFDWVSEEFLRIEKYSALGHLATFKEVIEYQQWKEKQN